ncbi:MAG: MamK family actin-like protein [Planctomycetota bacterium]|jgi:rod shape-determining protein MreB|nr:MamK family actin-like protein [Planctomycetota bacterium]MDP6989386.1 MamK family actin-like protein [Planctomycetota bacterium]
MSQVPTEESPESAKEGPAEPEAGVLYVGIDLGTSRTSVAASNGVRVTLASFVGYPKDVVSKKLLKQDVLYGDDAIEHRLSLDLYRPLEHGVLKVTSEVAAENEGNLRASRDLLVEAIRRARPRRDELVYAVIGAPAQASITSKNAIIDIARECVDSVMLCSEPFAVAYGQDMLDDVLVIDIGAGTVDLCRMHGTMPEDTDQITLETAGDSVDANLAELIRENHPGAQFSEKMLKEIKERHSSVAEVMQPILVTLPVAGKPTEFDLTAEIQAACRSIVPPIVDGLGQLVGSFDPEFQERLKDRVLLAGGGSQIKGLDLAIEREMVERLGGGKVSRIEEPLYGGANGALKIAHDMPEEFWERLK